MKGNTVLRIFIVLAVLIFFGHQIYASVYKPITTENVSHYETVDGLNVTGIIMRQEKLVTCKTDGVYHYLIADGSRVASGGTIANIYDSEEASMTMLEIDKLSAQIADMRDLQRYNNQQAADLELINGRITDSYNELVRGCADGNYETLSTDVDTLQGDLNRRQVATGQMTDFSKQISQMKKRLKNLQNSLPAAKGSIKASLSGYFSTMTDGYETVFSGEDLSVYTAEFLDKMKPKKTPGNVVGKIVSDYDWYILAKMPLNDSLRYKVGDSLVLQTEIKSSKNLDVTVAQINVSEKKDSAVVIFACSQMCRELASMRTGAMTIVNKTYEGLKVARSALRVVDSVRGVYVVSGVTLEFVPINILYSNEEFIICEQQQSTDTVLRLYDEVVVKGKNLYAGKVVN